MNTPNPHERLIRYVHATPQQQTVIDEYLTGKRDLFPHDPDRGPLLLGMGKAAEYLGVSRATLWRMIQAGRISKVEVLRDSYRVRRCDIETIARTNYEKDNRKTATNSGSEMKP